MNLEQLLALLRGAGTPEARTAAIAALTAVARGAAFQAGLTRAQELRAIEARTADQNAELSLLLDGTESLRSAIESDNQMAARMVALGAFDSTPAAASAQAAGAAIGRGATASSDRGASAPAATVEAGRSGIRGLSVFNTPEGRAMERDLHAYGVSDQRMEYLAGDEYRGEFDAWLRSFVAHPTAGVQSRAMAEATVGAGGAVVPLSFIAQVVQRRKNMKRVASMVNRINVSTDRFQMPKIGGGSSTQINDLAVQWTGEAGTATEDTSLQAWKNISIDIHRGGLVIVCSRALLEDAAFDLESWITDQIADLYAAVIDNMIISGSGVGRPFGLTARVGNTTPAADLITVVNLADPIGATGLMSMVGNMEEAYADNCQWLMRRATYFQYIAALRDSVGGFLFGTNLTIDGGATPRVEDQLLGYGCVKSDFVAASATAAKALWFGDFRAAYTLAERITLMIEPHYDPAIQKADQRAWYVRFRVGGDMIQENAIRCGVQS